MQKNILMKGLVFEIIVLFIEVSVSPCLNGNNITQEECKKVDVQSSYLDNNIKPNDSRKSNTLNTDDDIKKIDDVDIYTDEIMRKQNNQIHNTKIMEPTDSWSLQIVKKLTGF